MRSSIESLLTLQEGVASRPQLLTLGMSSPALSRSVERGDLFRILPGVYRAAGTPESPFARLMAVRLWSSEAVFGYATAAALHAFDGFTLDAAELIVPRPMRHSLDGEWTGFVIHSTRALGPGAIETYRRSLPPRRTWPRSIQTLVATTYSYTTASRTVIDLAQYAAPNRDEIIAAAIDSACALGKSSPAYLSRSVEVLRPGRPWIARVDRQLVDAGGHSWLEREFLRIVREAGLPTPRTQVVHRADGSTLRVDCEYTDAHVVVELSGRKGHSTDTDRAKDARRRNELQQAGFVVLEFVRSDVVMTPEKVVGSIARALSRPRLAA